MQTVYDKIDVFEKHVRDRQLLIAQLLGQHFVLNETDDPLSESGFAILHLCFQYFEMYEQFATGKDSDKASRAFFEEGFKKVFPSLGFAASDIERIYKLLRCGMYHTAMPKDRCGLSRDLLAPITNDNGIVLINPALFVDAIISHFRQYCSELRDVQHYQLQSNFERMWDIVADKCYASGALGLTQTSTTPEPTYYRP